MAEHRNNCRGLAAEDEERVFTWSNLFWFGMEYRVTRLPRLEPMIECTCSG